MYCTGLLRCSNLLLGLMTLKGFSVFLGPTMMRIIIICVVYNPFSRMATRSPTDKRKVLMERSYMALKYLAYGCSINTFWDYFQMRESTAMKCVKMFIKDMCNSSFWKKYFNVMTPADAKRVEEYHKEVHGVHGMIGSLDCSHFVWGNCPVAHHGQFQGKEGKPTLVVEAMVDHTLYV
jgi:hypothetical protein